MLNSNGSDQNAANHDHNLIAERTKSKTNNSSNSYFALLGGLCWANLQPDIDMSDLVLCCKVLANTLLQINMEVERASNKTTILFIGPSISFHVN